MRKSLLPMTERRIEHIYDCSEEEFWDEVFLDPDYNQTLYEGELRFERWKLVAERREGDLLVREVEAQPPVPDLPGPLKKLAEGGVGYRELGRLDRARKRYTLAVTPQSMANKLTITGELTTKPAGEKKCQRIYVATVEAKVFGVGRLIEQYILDDLQKSYEKAARFTNRWIAERLR